MQKRLSKKEQEIIVQEYSKGKSVPELSEEFEVSRQSIYYLLNKTNNIRNINAKIGDDFLSKEKLQELVGKTTSFSGLLDLLGKPKGGENYNQLQSWLEKFSIDTSHFYVGKLPLDDLLVENSPYKGTSTSLKNRLLSAGILEEKCEECGQSSHWNHKKLVLQLDHKNGNRYDNRRENLRILCPNCHTQTETFGGKRRKNQRFVDKRIVQP